jgi:hypothetical protein
MAEPLVTVWALENWTASKSGSTAKRRELGNFMIAIICRSGIA